ncbi:hypothetical protein HYFRA_00011745 [Hymenoscyphus fraxineus]|uniref:Tafazzin n=1 Tax=Hymenoscyphus fraxineus TaxID=746836 RepID=A0A9N9L472_9HELO|nr:hypothetical protein HYFRA_00011745 [Hymenoscyphus fraxineus]
MPKKRTSNYYTKPPSTVHPSLGSGAAGPSSSSHSDVQSVNDLIASARRTHITPSNYAHLPPTFSSQTLPPQTRQLLSQPETPPPRPRHRQPIRLGRNGRPIAGPAPPRSWLLEGSRYAEPVSELRKRQPERLYPTSIDHFPGLPETKGGRRLQDMCLRTMARNWEFVKEYERNNLAVIPTSHRMLLLSCIALYGPEEGVGYDGLSSLAILPSAGGEAADEAHEEVGFNPGINNETFHRLDLSGSIGRSLTFKQLIELVEIPTEPQEEPEEQLSWEDTIARPLSAVIPHLTHLSLSHPPRTVSWAKLLGLAKHIPALTHLSLAYWPVPTLTPNSQTVKVSSKYTRDIQYGATNMYSHTIDDNYQEAVDILRRLARTLYSIEFLDLSGCTDWLRAMTWHDGGEMGPGLEWCNLWVKLSTLRLYSGVSLTPSSTNSEVAHFIKACKLQLEVQDTLNWWAHPFSVRRRKIYTRVEIDDPSRYDGFWFGKLDEESKKIHRDLIWFRERERMEAPEHIVMGAMASEVHTPVIWD